MVSFGHGSWNIFPHIWRNVAILLNSVWMLKFVGKTDKDDTQDPSSRLWRISRDDLVTLVKENNLEYVQQFGGVREIASALESDVKKGIKGDARDLSYRRAMFGSNTYSPLQLLPAFLMETLKEMSFLILLCAATLSLAMGIKRDGWKDGWYDGGDTFLLLILVAVVSVLKKFRHPKLTETKSSQYGKIPLIVIRNGRRQQISILDIVVGDIVHLRSGDQVPADGLFIGGYLGVDLYPEMGKENKEVVSINVKNPFLCAHSKVVRGKANMLVTSVGFNTLRGEILGSMYRDSDVHKKPLLDELDKLSSFIENIGAAITLLLLVVLSFRCFTTINTDDDDDMDPDPDLGFYGGKTEMRATFEMGRTLIMKQNLLMKKLLCIFPLFLALPPNMAVPVHVFFHHWSRRMKAIGVKVRHFSSIGTMARVSTIIIDKECVLTSRQIVTEFSLGREALSDDLSTVATKIRKALCQGVGLSWMRPSSVLRDEFASNSNSEAALLTWAVRKLGMNMKKLEQTCKVLHVEAFDSKNKRSGLLVRERVAGRDILCVHWKGDARLILGMCSSCYTKDGIEECMDPVTRGQFEEIIQHMEDRGLQCIAFAHKHIKGDSKVNSQKNKKIGLTLLGLVGLKHLCQPEVRGAIKTCRDAGIDIKMVTKDDISTAKDLAVECGVLDSNMDLNEAVITGSRLLMQWPTERTKMLGKICLMARSSTFDEFLLVKCLKQNGHIVAITRVGTNNKPVLKEANLRVSMGSSDSKEMEESSDIIVLDNNLTSLLAVFGWGQCACNNIKKFVQLHVTMSLLWLTINFVEAVSLVEVPVTALQLLWVDLFVGTIGAVALAEKTLTEELAMDPAVGLWEPLITNVMWRNILAQALYQIAVMLTLQLKGEAIFSVEEDVKKALAFNTFFLCQVFNVFNTRELEEKNLFKGIGKNRLFWWLMGSAVVMQEVIMRFGPSFLVTKRLNWVQSAACIGLAAASLPVGCITRSIPVLEGPYLGLLGLLSRAARRILVSSRAQYMLRKLRRCRWINLRRPPESLPVTDKTF